MSHRVVGNDHVVIKDDGKPIVYSRVEMEDWKVRSYRRTRIVYDGRPYFISKSDRPSKDQFRYFLEPWPEESEEIPGKTLRYDDEFVIRRDTLLRMERKAERVSLGLRLLKPLIGLLFSETKLRIEQHYGIPSKRASRLSVVLELFVLILHAVWLNISIFVSLFSMAYGGRPALLGGRSYLITVVLILIPDIVVRYSRFMKEEYSPPGFYEWLFRRRKKT
jgi:hypothetical protein